MMKCFVRQLRNAFAMEVPTMVFDRLKQRRCGAIYVYIDDDIIQRREYMGAKIQIRCNDGIGLRRAITREITDAEIISGGDSGSVVWLFLG